MRSSSRPYKPIGTFPRLIGIVLLVLAAVTPAAASAPAAQKLPPLRPFKTETPPTIDGVLDDAVWKLALSETGFKTWRPDMGMDMHQNTVVYYAYDRENIYFAFRCYDTEPSKIKAVVSNRDSIQSGDDWICINLDSFNDQQSLYALYVNPLGIQADSKFEANNEDFSVDVVWYSAGQIDAEGYAIEIRLPFKSIRYASNDPVEMGIIFERSISRFSESGTYPPLDRAQGLNFVTQTRALNFEGVRHYTLFELLPAVTYGRTSVAEEGGLRAEPIRSDLSLTAKYGLTSQLILDGTVNPDFSQVEADAGQVDFNLRYALFYPEKRPFFLEGREKFAFAANKQGDPLGAIVHTRTIVNPYLGFKLNGKLGPKDTVASIYAMDELPEGSARDFAHFTIVRYKHALSEDSFLGGFLTGRFEGGHTNAVAGTDGQIRLTPAAAVGYHAFLSRTDPGAGSGGARDGHALGVNYSLQSRDWIINIYAQDLGRDFETETGYLARNGISRLQAGFLPMIYPKSKLFLRIDPIVHFVEVRDKESGLWETTEQADLRFILPRSTSVLFGGKYSTEVFLGRRFGRSGMRVIAQSQIIKQLSFSLIFNHGQKIRYVRDPYQGRGTDLSAEASFQPSENFLFDLSFIYSDFTRSAGDVKEYDYTILRSLNTYQVNKYLFFRAIVEYNSFYKELMTDFLASFTYIPGTVIHVGYGSLYDKMKWTADERAYLPSDRFFEIKRGFFFKASYLWRM
jgi:hypothetical protein